MLTTGVDVAGVGRVRSGVVGCWVFWPGCGVVWGVCERVCAVIDVAPGPNEGWARRFPRALHGRRAARFASLVVLGCVVCVVGARVEQGLLYELVGHSSVGSGFAFTACFSCQMCFLCLLGLCAAASSSLRALRSLFFATHQSGRRMSSKVPESVLKKQSRTERLLKAREVAKEKNVKKRRWVLAGLLCSGLIFSGQRDQEGHLQEGGELCGRVPSCTAAGRGCQTPGPQGRQLLP